MGIEKPNQCRSCGKDLQEDYNVCPYCGTPQKLICSNCGRELKEDFNACPYCGEKIRSKKAKAKQSEKKAPLASPELSEKAASAITGLGKLIHFIGRAVKVIALSIFDWLKNITERIIEWFLDRDWGVIWDTLKKGGGGISNLARKIFVWLKQAFLKVWALLKKGFIQSRGFLAQLLEKKFQPNTAKKAAVAIIAGGGLLVLCLLSVLIFGGADVPEKTDGTAVSYVSPESIPAVDPSEQKWLVMVYADADDEVLEEDIFFDLNEIEVSGSSDRVQVVAQLDRYPDGFTGDGDWSGARRYRITQDDDLTAVNSELVADLGEIDMGDTSTLLDFAIWAIETYPADRHVLILSDHGSGWPGGWYDDDPTEGMYISLDEMDATLADIIQQTGIGKFEIVGMDACLMGMLEVYNMLEPYARYAVASEEYEPSQGWAYSGFLGELIDRPEMSGSELAAAIVDSYIQQDLAFHDDASREAILAGLDLPLDIPVENLVNGYSKRATLSAVDLSALSVLNNSLDQLLLSLREIDKGKVAEARSYAQAFMNIIDDQFPSPYIDLKSFLDIIAQNTADGQVAQEVGDVASALDLMIVAEKHGENLPGASGISIYFPVSQYYWEGGSMSYEGYHAVAERFAANSLWEDFLAFHYYGDDFDDDTTIEEAKRAAPGYTEVLVSGPFITPGSVPADKPLMNVEVEVEAERVSYIYLVALLKYEDRYLFYQFDFLPGDKNDEVNGVIYPRWERDDGVIHLDFDYQIAPSAVTDGTTAAFVVMEPEMYGLSPEETINSVKGWYIFSDSGRKVSARIYFYNDEEGRMRNIVGYFGSSEQNSAPAEIIPNEGDQFQFIDTWWEFDVDGNIIDVLRDGNTLTFGDEPFTHGITPQYVYPGEYQIGIMVEDMDGNQNFAFSPLVVE